MINIKYHEVLVVEPSWYYSSLFNYSYSVILVKVGGIKCLMKR